MARKLVVFGNLAVGPIAIGNVAIGYVAIGFTVAIGPIAIGLNSLGFILAIGLNAVAPIDLAAINGLGALSFAGVNALGTIAYGGVNHGHSPIAGLLLGLAEGVAAYVLGPSGGERPEALPAHDFAKTRVLVKRASEEGLELARGPFLPWAEDVGRGYRRALAEALAETTYPLVEVEVRTVERVLEEDRYREAPAVAHRREVYAARHVPIERWYAPVFFRTLVTGAAIAFAVVVASFLLR
jgi:hypothetical protein